MGEQGASCSGFYLLSSASWTIGQARDRCEIISRSKIKHRARPFRPISIPFRWTAAAGQAISCCRSALSIVQPGRNCSNGNGAIENRAYWGNLQNPTVSGLNLLIV